ncbi:Hpt domain-containing protein, partial [Zemynaea arenosa]
MTDSSYATPFDTGPLSWVMAEIRDALSRSRASLEEAARQGADAQATSLQHAKTHLHQAHGALQMVDVEGVGLMTQAAEDALERFKSGGLEVTPERVEVVGEGYQAVAEYLEELLAGAPQQPARLFPYYRALQEMLGAERVHPADLLLADLSGAVELPRHEATPNPDYAAYRVRFERSLLPFLKSGDAAAAKGLCEALQLVADAQSEPRARHFWFAMQTFAELVAGGQVASDVHVKQLFGQINLQIRRLSQGQAELPETMLRDALFFIAAAENPSAGALALRRAYRLDGVVPHDYHTRRYGRIDQDALRTAKDALAEAKNAWGRLASEIDGSLEQRFEASLEAFEDASERLGAPGLKQLLAELIRVAKDSIKSGRSEQFSLEMAAAMLFIEHSLDQIRQLPQEFENQAEAVGARLLALAAGETPPDAPEWQGDLSRQIQQGQTVQVLADEMKTGLRQVEKVLDDYYADASRRAGLAEIDPVLHQLQGALAILDQDDAMRAAQHVKDAVRALAGGGRDADAEKKTLENIAQNVGALGFFIDTLAHSHESARERFEFDESLQLFRSVPFGRVKQQGAAPQEAPQAAPPMEAQDAAPGASATAFAAPTDAAPPPPPPPPAPPESVEAADEAIEAELLEIFIGEAQEVLALVGETLPAAHAEPGNQETLTRLRRSFHTLKGSGRMVGLNQFAEGAHAIEKVMNLWLSEARAATPDLLALLDRAAHDMTEWVLELAATGKSARNSDAVVAAAARVQDGEAFVMDEPAQPSAEVIEMPLPAPSEEVEALAVSADIIEFPTISQPTPLPVDDDKRRVGDIEIPLPLYNIYLAETDELLRTLERDFSEWRHEPQRAVSPDALKAVHTLTGTSATVGFTALREVAYALELALQALAPPAPQLKDTQRDLFDTTLAVVRDMLQRFAAGDLAPAQPEIVEQLDQMRTQLAVQLPAEAPSVSADPALAEQLDTLFNETYARLIESPPPLEPMTPLGELPKVPEHVVEEVDQLFDTAFDDPFDAPVLTQVAPPEDFAPPAPEAGVEAAEAAEAETVLPVPEAMLTDAPVEHDDVEAFTDGAVPAPQDEQHAEDFALSASPAVDAEELVLDDPESPAPEITAADLPDIVAIDALHAPVLEDAELVQPAAAENDAEHVESFALSASPASDAEELIEDELVAAPVAEANAEPLAGEPDGFELAPLPAGDELEAALEPELAALPIVAEAGDAVPVAAGLTDELDADLLPVFLEEGTDLLPQIGNALRTWQQNPADASPAHALQRMLHTVKGSARMAGAMRLGQHTHDIETQVENMLHAGTTSPAAFDELLANYDQAMLMFEQLQAGGAMDAGLPAATPLSAEGVVAADASVADADAAVSQALDASIAQLAPAGADGAAHQGAAAETARTAAPAALVPAGAPAAPA